MEYQVIQKGRFNYIESQGGQEHLLLLHGLFGALSNFEGIINAFKGKYNVVVPILPIFDLPPQEVSLEELVKYVHEFVDFKQYDKVHVVGNSLGGHLALLYTLAHPEKVSSITLTGSSGLFESAIGSSFPQRESYEFVKTKTEATFYDPKIATKELVDEVFDIVNDRNKTLAVIYTARSAIRNNLEDKLNQIQCPALLIWGNQDTITPPFVGEKFKQLIFNSTLHFIDKCGHAPMMEHPELFNKYLGEFLEGIS